MKSLLRSGRQEMVYQWVSHTFGADHANNLEQRIIRFFEEAIELYQACGGDRRLAHKLIDFNFDKPAGDIAKELGDTGFTLLSVAAASGLNADEEEDRIALANMRRARAEMMARNQAKNDAGFEAGANPCD